MQPPKYEVFPDKISPGDWRVEACGIGSDGECYVAIFSGALAEDRAREYAEWKNRRANDKAA